MHQKMSQKVKNPTKLSRTEITALLELVNNKLENNVASLSEFNRLLDAVVDSKVIEYPSIKH